MMKVYWKVIGLIILTLLIFTGVGWVMKPVDKMVEREVMVNSHQYKEGMEQRAITLQSSIAELDGRIAMNPENVAELRAQKRALQIQLQAAIK